MRQSFSPCSNVKRWKQREERKAISLPILKKFMNPHSFSESLSLVLGASCYYCVRLLEVLSVLRKSHKK